MISLVWNFCITWKVWFQGEMPFMDYVSTIHGLCVYYAALSLGEWNSWLLQWMPRFKTKGFFNCGDC